MQMSQNTSMSKTMLDWWNEVHAFSSSLQMEGLEVADELEESTSLEPLGGETTVDADAEVL